jgi:hypothetical protein
MPPGSVLPTAEKYGAEKSPGNDFSAPYFSAAKKSPGNDFSAPHFSAANSAWTSRVLEAVLQGELDGARWQPCVNEVLLGQRFKLEISEPDAVPWDAEVRPIEEVEEFTPELEFLPFTDGEDLVDCQINGRNARRAV